MKGNEVFEAGLRAALAAVSALDGMGVTVQDVRLGGRHPVIVVDREPPGVVAGYSSRETVPRGFCWRRVTTLHGCEVQWTEYRSRSAVVAGGVA